VTADKRGDKQPEVSARQTHREERHVRGYNLIILKKIRESKIRPQMRESGDKSPISRDSRSMLKRGLFNG
jgi:hypothetical protein